MSLIDTSLQWFRDHSTITYCLVSGVALVGAFKTKKWIAIKKKRAKWNSAPRDTVVLHIIPRGKTAPSMSPFVVKLETYLRMASIPYVADFSKPMGPKGKTPWITLNGEDFTDSQLIMEFLGRKYNKDFSKHLTPEQRAAGRSLQIMMDEHFFWGLALWRVIYDRSRSISKIHNASWIMQLIFTYVAPRIVKKYTWAQGVGRHSETEVTDMMLKDLRAVADYLGSKPFLLGSEPTEYDCAIFGMVSQCVWCLPGSPYEKAVEGELKVLKDYCLRMKDRFWKDWDSCIYPPKK